MGKSQRTKGAAYEREVVDAFNRRFTTNFKRNIGQARDGGNDIDIGRLVVECKRRKSLKTLEGFMRQAEAATATGLASRQISGIPVVVMREDEGQSMLLMRLEDFFKVVRPEFVDG